jgi:cytochrome c-type biogenesis protein CcmH
MKSFSSGLALAAALALGPALAGAGEAAPAPTAQAPTAARTAAPAAADAAAAPAAMPAAAPAEGVHAGPDPADLIGAPHGPTLAGAALESRTHEVASTIRCPVCQGVSIADSPSEMAQNMKRQTGELLARGYDAEQITHYFEQSYGEFIRLQPKADGLKSFVWIAPGLLLLVGAFAIARYVSRHRGGPAAMAALELPARDRLPDDPALVPWVKKARELAYGWPGGVPPKGDA